VSQLKVDINTHHLWQTLDSSLLDEAATEEEIEYALWETVTNVLTAKYPQFKDVGVVLSFVHSAPATIVVETDEKFGPLQPEIADLVHRITAGSEWYAAFVSEDEEGAYQG